MVLAVLDWTTVIVATISALGSLAATVAALLVRREVKTPNSATLGERIEEVHQLVSDVAPIARAIEHGDVEPPHGTNGMSVPPPTSKAL